MTGGGSSDARCDARRASTLDFDTLHLLTGGGLGQFDVACPACGPDRRHPANRIARKLRIWRGERDFVTYACARCGIHGPARAETSRPPRERRPQPSRPTSAPSTRLRASRDDAERTACALEIWDRGDHPSGTPVIPYFGGRGLELPAEAAGEAIRWHPDCPFGPGVSTGCMLALVRDIRTDAPMAIHRTAVTADGRRAVFNGVSRLSLGPIGGGGVKLTPDGDVALGLGVGEGIETTLSLRHLPGCEALATWALLAANQLAAFPVLPGLEGLWIAVDHDPVGIAAADALRRRWQVAGVDVVTARPAREGADLNDIARASHVA